MVLPAGAARRLVLVAVLFALTTGVIALDWGLPYLWHTDEKVELAADMLARRSPDPQYFVNPTFHIYLVTGAVWLAERIAPGEIQFQMRAVPPLTERTDPNRAIQFLAHQLARGVSVLAAVLAVWMLWRSVRRPLGEWAAAVAALALAVSMGLMNVAHFATPEAVYVLETVLALWVFARLTARGRLTDALIVGLIFGIACSTKYTAIFLSAPLVWAIVLTGRRGTWPRALGVGAAAGGVAVAAFFAGTPYAAIHWHDFVVGGLDVTMRTGAPSGSLVTESHSWGANLVFLADAMSWPLALVGAISFAAFLWRRRHLEPRVCDVLSLHAIWIVTLWLSLGLSSTSSMRFMVPAVPSMAVLIGWGLTEVRRSAVSAALRRGVLVTGALAMGYAALYTGVGAYAFLHDTRYAAGAWLTRHLVRDVNVSYFTVEAYVPFFDRPKYDVNYHSEVWPSRAHDDDFTAWSRAELAALPDVLVDSDLFYPRFFDDPASWPGRAEMYRSLFSNADPSGYRLVASFEWKGLAGIHPTPELVAPRIVIFAKAGQVR